MLKTRMKRIADRTDRAVQQLAAIEASIVGLTNDDLLDLADIFGGEPGSPLSRITAIEMAKRQISL